MGLEAILVFSVAALGVAALARHRTRLLLTLSVLALYWLQPALTVRSLDFWLPTLTLALVITTWMTTRPQAEPWSRADLWTTAWIAILVAGLACMRYLGPACCLTHSRPPEIWQVILVILGFGVLSIWAARWIKGKTWSIHLMVILLLVVFVVIKTEPLAQAASAGLRSLTGQQTSLASALDLRWLGFSYVAFRLIHTLRDRAAGRLPAQSLEEFMTYATFFPALVAGPIDRNQRFIPELRKPFRLSGEEAWSAGWRILLGLFKKFAIADTLALVALNSTNASQVHSTGWLWVLLYAYALRIYFDFSGYTDIAIGVGRLAGIHLPENFDAPYRKPNLTQFWNSWHMTLAQWFRAYFFNPLTRTMRSSPKQLPMPLIILAGQLGTMALIGLWHGVTWNFLVWGIWHGLGLFVHNRWQEFARFRGWEAQPGSRAQHWQDAAGVFLTFNYVALGWVWFALPNMDLSWRVLRGLLGG